MWVGIQAVVWKSMRYEGGNRTDHAVLLGLRAGEPMMRETRLGDLSGTGNDFFFFRSSGFIIYEYFSLADPGLRVQFQFILRRKYSGDSATCPTWLRALPLPFHHPGQAAWLSLSVHILWASFRRAKQK
jgi:hypothetical protein